MNVQPNLRMDKPTFLAWADARDERYELVGGTVVMMPRPDRAHGMLLSNLIVALRKRLDPDQWTVIAEFGLDAGPDTLRYPNIVVDRAGGRAKDYTATAAVLLVEVLSPSTATIDLGDKAAEYLQLPSLAAYVVLSQDDQKAWLWVRGATGFTAAPEVVTGPDAVIRLGALGIELALSETHSGVALTPP